MSWEPVTYEKDEQITVSQAAPMRTRIRELVSSSRPPGGERGPISQARKPRVTKGACPRPDGDSQRELDPGESSLQGPAPSRGLALRTCSWGPGGRRHTAQL